MCPSPIVMPPENPSPSDQVQEIGKKTVPKDGIVHIDHEK